MSSRPTTPDGTSGGSIDSVSIDSGRLASGRPGNCCGSGSEFESQDDALVSWSWRTGTTPQFLTPRPFPARSRRVEALRPGRVRLCPEAWSTDEAETAELLRFIPPPDVPTRNLSTLLQRAVQVDIRLLDSRLPDGQNACSTAVSQTADGARSPRLAPAIHRAAEPVTLRVSRSKSEGHE